MTMTALLKAAKTEVVNRAKLDKDACKVRIDGKPTPLCGDLFVAIHGTELTPENADWNSGIDPRYGIAVTVTKRVTYNPYDDNEEAYVGDCESIDALCDLIIPAINLSYDLIERANTSIKGNDKFIEPLRWLGTDPAPTYVGGEWFVVNGEVDEGDKFDALVTQIRFGMARRPQSNANFLTNNR